MRQFEDWHFTKGAVDAPQEYADYVLCAHIYHCTPAELDDQDALTVSLHLDFWGDEQKRASKKKVRRIGKPKRNLENNPGAARNGRPSADELIRMVQQQEGAGIKGLMKVGK